MFFSSADKKIILTLYESSKKIELYDLHKQFSFSPAQLSRFTRKFQKKRVIDYSNGYIKLTDYGKNWVIKNRRLLFLTPKQKKWVNIPDEWKVRNNFKKVKFDPSLVEKK